MLAGLGALADGEGAAGHGEVVVGEMEPHAGAGGDAEDFVEVVGRAASEEYGPPEAAVDAEKRIALQRTAREYSRRSGVEWDKTRFDIVSVVLEKPVRIEWLRDAFR